MNSECRGVFIGYKTGVNIVYTLKTARKQDWSIGLNKDVTVMQNPIKPLKSLTSSS